MNTTARVEVCITDAKGLHARSAGSVAKLARTFTSHCTIACKGKTANARSILELLTLCADRGENLLIECRGADAKAASIALEDLVLRNFASTNHG